MFYIFIFNFPLRNQVCILLCLVHKTDLFGLGQPLIPSPMPMEKEITMHLPTRRHCMPGNACLRIYDEIMAFIALDGMEVTAWGG